MSTRRFLRTLTASVALLAGAHAAAAPYATTYTGAIANSQITANALDGAAFILTLVFDNGGSSAASQNWDIGQLTCGFWRWRVDDTRSVTVALDMSGGLAQGAGSVSTNAAGELTAVYASVDTGGPLAWADYDVSGLPAGSAIGWFADGNPQVFGLMANGGGGSFDDGTGPGGGVQMTPGRWQAPLPFTGACDASAVPPTPPGPPAPVAVPTLPWWGLVVLGALLARVATRRRFLNHLRLKRPTSQRQQLSH